MFLHEDGIDEGFFFGGVGIQFPAHVLHAVEDMPSLAAGGTFEKQMFREVRETELILRFIPRPRIDGKAAVGNRRIRRQMNYAKPVRQLVQMIVHIPLLILRGKDRIGFLSGSKNTAHIEKDSSNPHPAVVFLIDTAVHFINFNCFCFFK
ncbi:hypothetical protein Barb7_03233 [Bacteroidales bacterium Barb7]|nr:hypothetical protein Barb7_03233 [Bacteroidales bacterium Barb7]